jgi:hypothetical protein
VFWKFANNTETDDGEHTPKSGSRLLFTRGYSVFNAAQVEGYTPKAVRTCFGRPSGAPTALGGAITSLHLSHGGRLPCAVKD